MNILLYRQGLGKYSCEMIAEASRTGLKAVLNNNIPVSDFCFRWGTTSTLPGNPKVVNTAKAIHYVFDKRASRKAFADVGYAPKTWTSFEEFCDSHGVTNPIPDVIVRPSEHSRSENLHFCNSYGDVYRAIKKYDSYYISEYIEKEHEWRVFIVQGRVIAVLEKHPHSKDEISWGCVSDDDPTSYFRYVEWGDWDIRMIEQALGAFRMSGLDFGAVDVMSKSDTHLVLEINTGPQLTPYYAKCFAQAFDYIVEKGRDHIPVSGSSWKHVIHPAKYEGAIL